MTLVRKIPTELRGKTARELLVMGFDTFEIAASREGIPDEAAVYNEIGRTRGMTYAPKAMLAPASVKPPRTKYPIEEIEVGGSFLVPAKNPHARGQYINSLKQKLGTVGQFICTPEDEGIRVVRLS